MLILEIAAGVVLGTIALIILNGLVSIPARVRAIRAERKFKRLMQETADHLMNMALEAKKEIENAERAKANQRRTGATKATGSRAKKAGSRTASRSGSKKPNSTVRSGSKGTSKKSSNKS